MNSWLNTDPTLSHLTPHPPPPPPLAIVRCTKGKTGIRTGFAGLAKSLAYCVQKLSRLGFDARGTPRWMKQKRVENSKAKFYERAEKFVETKEGCKKLTAKTGYVLAQKKSCQQFSQDTGSNRVPCLYLPDKS